MACWAHGAEQYGVWAQLCFLRYVAREVKRMRTSGNWPIDFGAIQPVVM